jgi:PAS domain S-box-containing protein
MGAARILIVEDDAILATHKEDTLGQMGYQVIGITATGEQAVDIALSQRPDVILMDIRLRGEMTGIQAAKTIHEKADIPIIYLTAYTDDLLVEQAKITEPYAYLAKLVGDRELRASLEMALYKHRAEQLVRQERDRAQQYLDIAGVVIVALDRAGNITMLNRRGYELLGYLPGELDGKDWTDTCVPSYLRERLKETFYKLIAGEIELVEFYENPVLTRSGEERLVAWHNRLIRDEPGNIIGSLSSGEDITERKRAEEALRREQNLMNSLMEKLPDAIYFKDLESRFIRTNKATADKHGLESPQQAIGKTDLDFFTKESAEVYYNDEQTIIRTGQLLVNIEEEEQWPDRPSSWASITKMPLYDEAGNIVGTFGISRDITERKKAERTFKKHAAQLELLNAIAHQIGQAHAVEDVLQRVVSLTQELFGYQHVGIFTLDQERKALVMRAKAGAFAALFPDGHKLAFGQGMVSWVCQNDRSLLANDADAEPSYINCFPEVLKTRSELTVPIHLAGEVLGVLDIQSDSLNAFDANDLIVMETLADQVSVALENARLVQSLERELSEKEVLLREIHHRIKNNLEVVLSLADMQARRVDDLRAKQSLHVLQERIRTIALVHESLYRSPSLAYIQSQKYLQQLTGNLYLAFGTAGINLLVQAEDIIMNVDTAMPCGLIVTELVTNAFKYAFPADQKDVQRGSDEITKEIRVSLKRENHQIVLQVSDNGVGLPEGLNWQTSKSLGLRLVTSLTGQLHGSLEVHSLEGTQVQITFPAQEGVEP